jgi:hypothetical protein
MAGDMFDHEGNLRVFPISGFGIAPVAESSVLLRIQYLRDEATRPETPEVVHFVLSPMIAEALASDLAALARKLSASPPSDAVRN